MPKKDPTTLRRGQPWNSLLTPFEDEIRQLRKQRKTYREIATILRERHGEAADFTASAIWKFVRVRARRTPYALPDPNAVAQPGAQAPQRAPAGGAALSQGVTLSAAPRPASAVPAAIPGPSKPRGMLAPQHSKFRDSTGKPVPPPPDPHKFRSENL